MSSHAKEGITAAQVRAARGLLDWSQEDLAEACDLSIATIRKIETGHISPRHSTMNGIKIAFEDAGLEFIAPGGVREKPEDITVYNGHQGTVAFFDEVYQEVQKNGGEVVVVCISEGPFMEALGDYLPLHLSRMADLKNKLSVKCIIMEDLKERPATYCEYRALSKDYVDSVPFYVFGNNYAIFLFDAQPSPKIIVHRSPLLAAAYRRQFHSMWNKACVLDGPNKGKK